MTIEFRLNGFNSSNAKSFYKVLRYYGLTFKKSIENDTRIIKFDKDFGSGIRFIEFCQEVSQKYTDRKQQNVWKCNISHVDIAVNNISEPYIAVFTLYIKKS